MVQHCSVFVRDVEALLRVETWIEDVEHYIEVDVAPFEEELAGPKELIMWSGCGRFAGSPLVN